jgi:hypothetical protein
VLHDNDLLVYIFSFLPRVPHLIRLNLVCKNFSRVCSMPPLWQEVDLSSYLPKKAPVALTINHKGQYIRTLRIVRQSFSKSYSFQDLMSFNHWAEFYGLFGRETLPNLEKLAILHYPHSNMSTYYSAPRISVSFPGRDGGESGRQRKHSYPK